jgi:phage gp45-like
LESLPKDGGVVQSIQYQTPLEVASAPRMAEFGFSSGLPAGLTWFWLLLAVIVPARW